eukprot:2577471-Prymnesium_polylepis.1
MRVVKVLRVFLWRWRCPGRPASAAQTIAMCARYAHVATVPRRSPAACPTAPGPYRRPVHA